MSHEFESGFVVREQAWHGLATVLSDAPSVEDAIVQAGLDWEVKTAPLSACIVNPDGVESVDVDTHKALIRSTDRSILGVVTRAYKVFQNREAFGWFQPLVEDGTVKLETAGSLQGGRKVWILGRYADDVEITDGDRIVPYLLLAAGHDGNLSIRILNTPIRVVCWNTLSAAGIRDDADAGGVDSQFQVSGGYSISHVGNVAAKVKVARDTIVTLNRELQVTVDRFRTLARVPATEEFVRAAVREVFDADYLRARQLVEQFRAREAQAQEHADVEIRAETRQKVAELEAYLANPTPLPTERKIVEAFRAAPGAAEAGQTAWGALNAITYHLDHGKRSSADQRLSSTWFGSSALQRAKATEVITALAGVD